MADRNLNEPEGVSIKRFHAGTYFDGTREDLIADGVCTADHFPEGSKRLKWCAGGLQQGEGWRMKYLRGGRWRFTLWHDLKPAPQVRGSNYGSPQAWLDDLHSWFAQCMNLAMALADGTLEREIYGETTLCLDDKSLEQLRFALEETCATVRNFQASWVGSAARANRALPAARQDQQLQAFLSKLSAGNGD